jgi:uncharacterized membrane protein
MLRALVWLLTGSAVIAAGGGLWWLRGAWWRALDRCLAQATRAGLALFVVLRPVPWVLVALAFLVGLSPVVVVPAPISASLVVWLLVAGALAAATSDWPAQAALQRERA